MKILLALITASTASIAFQACESFPIKGKACYTTKDGQQVCVSSSGQGIEIDATFAQQK